MSSRGPGRWRVRFPLLTRLSRDRLRAWWTAMSGIERATYGAAFLVAITGLIGVVSAAIITAAVPYWRAGDADGDGPPSAPPTTSAITTPPSTTAEPTPPTSTMPLFPTTTPPFAGSPVELSASIAGRRTVEVTAENASPSATGIRILVCHRSPRRQQHSQRVLSPSEPDAGRVDVSDQHT